MPANNLKTAKNPLTTLWNIISAAGTILGLVSFTDNFVTWKSIFSRLVEGYKAIVYFPFHFLEISINDYVIDYLFIGSICGASFYKAISYGIRYGYLRGGSHQTGVKVFYFILYLLFWPLGIIITVKQILIKDENVNERQIKTRFVQWLLATLIGFIVFLIINTMLPDKL